MRIIRFEPTSAAHSAAGSSSVTASRMVLGRGTSYSRMTVRSLTSSGAPYW